MIQCKDCQYFKIGPHGEHGFTCDPFVNIVEPECLAKWQLIKINQMVAGYQATLNYYQKLAPLQEKVFKIMEREMDDIDESEKWKVDEEEEKNPWENDDENNPGGIS
jgi:hypothetical protein